VVIILRMAVVVALHRTVVPLDAAAFSVVAVTRDAVVDNSKRVFVPTVLAQSRFVRGRRRDGDVGRNHQLAFRYLGQRLVAHGPRRRPPGVRVPRHADFHHHPPVFLRLGGDRAEVHLRRHSRRLIRADRLLEVREDAVHVRHVGGRLIATRCGVVVRRLPAFVF